MPFSFQLIVALALGFFLGLIVSWLIHYLRFKAQKSVSDQALIEQEKALESQRTQMLDLMKQQFESLSLQALSRSSQELMNLAKTQLSAERSMGSQELEHKKVQIDDHLKKMDQNLSSVMNALQQFEKERIHSYSELSTQIKQTNQQTSALLETTTSLKNVLTNSKARGYWGERIAEDILRLAGFVENVNYTKQKTLNDGSRPDYTFLLPQEMRLNMDVKFPIANYLRFIEAENDLEKETFKKAFLRDVKARLKELQTRDYISARDNTVDCVVMFIPHEQVFSFVQSEDPALFDEGIKNKVISCSPMTLFAVLAVIRQAVDYFAIEKASGEILKQMSEFRNQWEKYSSKFEVLGKKISDTQKEYEALTTTRRRMLDRSLDKLERIQLQSDSALDAQHPVLTGQEESH